MRSVTQQRSEPGGGCPSRVVLAVGWLVTLGAFAASATAAAQEPLAYAVNARVDIDTGAVEGAWVAQVRVEEGQGELRLWLYADRLAVVPEAMTEISGRWIFPSEVSLGEVTVEAVRVDGVAAAFRREAQPVGDRRGRDVAGSDLRLALPHDQGGVFEVRLRFRVQLARRFGRLAWVGDRVLLGAPWYPLVVGADGGWRHSVDHRVQVERADGGGLVVGQRDGEGVVVETRQGDFVPVYASDGLVSEQLSIEGGSLRLVYDADEYLGAPRGAQGLEVLEDVVRVERLSHLRARVREAALTWRMADVAGGQVPDLTVLFAPLRTELCASGPDWVMVSDRAYQLAPMQSLAGMHDAAMRRAIFRTWSAHLSATLDPAVDRVWADDLRAVLLLDLDRARRQGSNRTTEDILGWAGFHPSVDNLLYAPQVSFVDVLFGSIHEPDPFRDSPDRAREPLVRGRALLGAIRDELTPESLRVLGQGLLRTPRGAREILQESRSRYEGADPATRLPEWLGVSESRVNYAVGDVQQTENESGGFRVQVPIHRDGEGRSDPVEVLVLDAGGTEYRGVWDGSGEQGVVEFETAERLARVTLDPRARLLQSPELADGHPRRDDIEPLPWRPPLLQQIDIASNPVDGSVRGSLDFVMRRRYDLERGFGLLLSTNERGTGGYARYIRGVGPKRTTNARIGSISSGVFLSRLHAGFAGEEEGAWRFGASLSGGMNSQLYIFDPREGLLLSGATRLALTRADSGELRVSFSAAARAGYTTSIGLRQAFVFVADTAWVWGDPLASERPALGGPFLLRSLLPGRVLGDGRVLGVVEYRVSALRDLEWNLIRVAWARELQIVGFTGVGLSVSPTGVYPNEWAAEFGVGARLHVEWGGFLPGVIAVDVATPVRESQREPPFNMRIGFSQFF